MATYYVNKNPQSNGDHEVHKSGCGHSPDPQNRQSLGDHSSCSSAVRKAKSYYNQVNGCYYCAETCHTQ